MKITGIPTNVVTSSVMTKTLVTLSFHQAAIFSRSLFQVPEAVCYNYLQMTACNSTELHFAGTLTNIVRIDTGELLLPRCIIIEWISSSSSILWNCLFSFLLRLERTTNSNRSDQESNMGPWRPISFTNVVLMKDWHGEPNLLLHEDSSLLRQERLSQFPVRQSILAEVLSGLESPPTAGTSRRIIRPHPAPASKQVRNSFCKSWSPGLESSRDNRGE